MKNRQILFTVSYTVKVTEEEFHPVLTGDQVLVRTEYTAISAGTERDNLKNGPICTVSLWMPILPIRGISAIAVPLWYCKPARTVSASSRANEWLYTSAPILRNR